MHDVLEAFGGRTEPVAAELGVSNQTVRNWVSAGRVHQAKYAVRLHQALRGRKRIISIAQLAGEDHAELPTPPPVRRRRTSSPCAGVAANGAQAGTDSNQVSALAA